MNFYFFIIKVCFLLLLISFSSCKKLIEISPSSSEVSSSTIFTNDGTALSALRGIYSEMVTEGKFTGKMFMLAGLSADEFINYEALDLEYQQFEDVSLNADNSYLTLIWTPCYKYIYYSNSILEGLKRSSGITPAVKVQIEGEAKFIRALCYFYLVNFFGDIPLSLTTDYRVNNTLSRSDKDSVYAQIIADLKDAKNNLLEEYPAPERIRPNKWAVTALLSRVYLYNKDWINAESSATEVINSSFYELENNPDNVFLKTSAETVWQLKSVDGYRNTWEGAVLIVVQTPPIVFNRAELMNTFETADARKSHWMNNVNGFDFAFKYKIRDGIDPLNEYSVVLRLSELYLIRAEARVKQDNLTGAISDVDMIRDRAELPLIVNTDPGISKDALLNKIFHERQVELFAEWCHRWFDLKRTDTATEVLSVVKPAVWNDTDVLYPIPQSERENNPNLTQNDGYN